MSKTSDPVHLTARQILDYLSQHPRFLQDHPHILDQLLPPEQNNGRGVLDFQHFMVKKLQADNDRLKDVQDNLLELSRANLNNQSRVHNAVLALLDARDFDELLEVLNNDLATLLDVDICQLVMEAPQDAVPQLHHSGVRIVMPGSMEQLFGRRTTILASASSGDEAIFGPAAPLVQSFGLVRLFISPQSAPGLLAFGSRDAHLFNDGQGTEQIMFLARVLERQIRLWLNLPA